MARHLPRGDLLAALPHILAAPKDSARIDMIVSRPSAGRRNTPDGVRVTSAEGVEGDHWSKGCWLSTDNGDPHPEVQLCIINTRLIDLLADGDRSRWPLAGDNFVADLDLSPQNLPVGQRLSLGEAEIVITNQLHAGCAAFAERYGRDACVFVNTGAGKANRLRGVYARVMRDGVVRVGDEIRKLNQQEQDGGI